MAVEVLPNPNPGLMRPVHQHVLAYAGVHLIENLVLDVLARDRVARFCFILLATKFKGATGCSGAADRAGVAEGLPRLGVAHKPPPHAPASRPEQLHAPPGVLERRREIDRRALGQARPRRCGAGVGGMYCCRSSRRHWARCITTSMPSTKLTV